MLRFGHNKILSNINPYNYLDSKNYNLWIEYSQIFNIEIKYHKYPYYENFCNGNKCIIFVPKDKVPDSCSFTHELLHLYLRSKNNFIGPALDTLKCPHQLNLIFQEDLLNHISNCLEHIKILPLFLDLGYPREQFLFDYFTPKVSEKQISILVKKYRCGYKKRKFSCKAITNYIAYFFATKADPNPKFNYETVFDSLKTIDNELFLLLFKFWNAWDNYDILTEHTFLNDYHRLIFNFQDALIEWSSNKNISKSFL